MNGQNMERRRARSRGIARLLLSVALSGPVLGVMATLPAAAQAQSLTIPAQPLSSAMSAFGRATGWQVAYPPALAGVTTRAVSGSLAPEAALRQMLEGTGIALQRTGASSAALLAPAATTGAASGTVLSPVMLAAQNSGTGPAGIVPRASTSASRTDTPLIETPQTVNVVGREQMEEQGATTVSQALRYTPGIVTGTAGAQSDRFDSYFVRGSGGFSADASYASTLDGLRWRFPDRTGVQFDPWMLERVEVVKGPASTLFGSGSPGGIVNLVSKQPEFTPSRDAYLAFGSHGRKEAGIDLTGPINEDFAYRFVALGRAGKTGIDYQHDERVLVAPSLTWAPTDDTRLTVQAMYQHDPKAPDGQFLPPLGSVLPIPGYGTVSPTFWQGDPNWQEYSRTQKSIGFQFDHQFNPVWSVHSRFRYGELDSTTKALDFAWMSDEVTMNRLIYLADHQSYSTAFDTYAQAKFSTGSVDHTLLAGVDYQKLSGGFRDGWDRANYPAINIFNPVYGLDIDRVTPFRAFRQPFEQTGFYLQEQASFGQWRFIAGLRHDDIRSGSSVTNGLNGAVTSSSAKDSKVSWQLGTVYLMDNGFAPFLNYSTSFEPELGVTASGDVLHPSTGKMLEGGLRYLAPSGDRSFGITLFSGSKDGQPVADSVNVAECATNVGAFSTCYTQDNKSEAKGVELEARASLAQGLDLIGSYTYQKVRLTESSDAAINPDILNGDRSVDKHLVGVPDQIASLCLNYRLPSSSPVPGLSVGGGVRYVGSTYATGTNVWGATEGPYEGRAAKVDSFTLVDLAVGYDFGAQDPSLAGLRANLNVTNLFDKDYVAACNGYGTCSFGAERRVLLTLAYSW